MQKHLYATGGVGIAANQCAEIKNPAQVIIVGTNHPAARELAATRYPEREFPNELVMLNPKIIETLEPYYPTTGEGCLSVMGGLRGQVKRYNKIVIEYQDLNFTHHTQTLTGFAAHIACHECDHLDGIVFLEKIIAQMTEIQLRLFIDCLDSVENEEAAVQIQTSLIFENTHKSINFEHEQLINCLRSTPLPTRNGIRKIIRALQETRSG